MTLQEAKNQIARDYGFQDWEHIIESYNPNKIVELTDEVAELYVKERKVVIGSSAGRQPHSIPLQPYSLWV